MKAAWHRARFDWLAEFGGASALGLAAGFAAFKAAPALGFAPPAAMLACGLGNAVLGLMVMRAVGPEPRILALPDFGVEPVHTEAVLELTEIAEVEPLLLETLYEEREDEIALLLEDVLPATDPDSRVVQLFAQQPMPTPGELRERIDRHLATGSMHVVREFEGPAPDASDALFAALNELKRSLR